jgi:hypothetical protein
MPSSSNMASDFGAFGFGDFTPSSPLSSTTRPLDLSPLHPELVVIIKNIQRRDPTTRMKAVQDLQTKITQDLDEQSMESLLNIWVAPLPIANPDHALPTSNDGF